MFKSPAFHGQYAEQRGKYIKEIKRPDFSLWEMIGFDQRGNHAGEVSSDGRVQCQCRVVRGLPEHNAEQCDGHAQQIFFLPAAHAAFNADREDKNGLDRCNAC